MKNNKYSNKEINQEKFKIIIKYYKKSYII